MTSTQPKPSTRTAVLYCRLSKPPKDGKVMTVAEQETLLRAEAKRRKLAVIDTYIDDGVSAFKGVDRPGFDALTERVRAGGIDYVITTALDRAARRVGDLTKLSRVLEEAGAQFILDGQVKDPDDDFLALGVGVLVAEQESREKSKRIRRAKVVAARDGLYPGGPRPFGYRKVGGEYGAPGFYRQDPNEAAAIRSGYEQLFAGATLKEIAEDWNTRGLDVPISAGKVHRALLSPTVAGLRTSGGKVIGQLKLKDGTPWPAILTVAEQQRVERELARRSGKGGPGRSRPQALQKPGLVSGLLICGVCGHRLRLNRGNTSGAKYACNSDGSGRCGTIAIDQAKVENQAVETFVEWVKPATRSKRITRGRQVASREVELRDELEQARADLAELDDAREGRLISMATFIKAAGRLETDIARLEGALAAASAEVLGQSRTAITAQFLKDGGDVTTFLSRPLEVQRALLASTFRQITVNRFGGGKRRYDPDRVVFDPAG